MLADLTCRALRAGEEHLFTSFPDPAVVGFAAFGRDYRALLASGQYRPEWTWVAQRGDTVVGRAAWWGGPTDSHPSTVDWLDFGDDPAIGAALLRSAAERPEFRTEYVLALPGSETAASRTAHELRVEAATLAGMCTLVRRGRHHLRLPAAATATRLRMRPEPDDEVIRAVLRRVHADTVDAHVRRIVERSGLDAAVDDELEFLHWLPSPRDWWRLAHTPDGRIAGLVVPGRNHTEAVVALVGVVPEQRGHGYAADLLAECCRVLADAGEHEVVGDTDDANGAMIAAFRRTGFTVRQRRHQFGWPG